MDTFTDTLNSSIYYWTIKSISESVHYKPPALMYKITSSRISPSSTLLANLVISYLNTSYDIGLFSQKKN